MDFYRNELGQLTALALLQHCLEGFPDWHHYDGEVEILGMNTVTPWVAKLVVGSLRYYLKHFQYKYASEVSIYLLEHDFPKESKMKMTKKHRMVMT